MAPARPSLSSLAAKHLLLHRNTHLAERPTIRWTQTTGSCSRCFLQLHVLLHVYCLTNSLISRALSDSVSSTHAVWSLSQHFTQQIPAKSLLTQTECQGYLTLQLHKSALSLHSSASACVPAATTPQKDNSTITAPTRCVSSKVHTFCEEPPATATLNKSPPHRSSRHAHPNGTHAIQLIP